MMAQLDDTQVYLPEIWASHARFRGSHLALVCGQDRLTWKELNSAMNCVANALLEMGIGRGDKVAILMSNSAEMFKILFGITKAGACVVPISTLLTEQQVATLLADSGAQVLFAGADVSELARSATTEVNSLRNDGKIGRGFVAEGWQDYGQWLGDSPDHEPPVRYDLGDEFNIIYSSGTTGDPKGIVQTHRARQHWSYSNALELRFTPSSIALATTSLYSNGTWFMLLPPMFVGATIVVMEKFSPQEWLSIVERERVTHSFMVPTQFVATLECPALDDHNLSSLKQILSAGSPLRPDTRDAIIQHITPGLFELYGFSEGFATICRPEQMDRQGSVGTPVVGFDLRIIDENDNEVPPGEAGEIVGYGGGLMREYHNKPEITAAAIWRDERNRTFLRSGDIGKVDEDGFLYILDRKKDMILSGGFNIFPKDIETVVGQHPDVSEVTVIGIPHEKWGETPLALIIAAPGATPDLDAICDWSNSRLAKTQRIHAIELRDDFPRNALGKVIKRQLRESYWSAS
jgi:acyl-CoA synthetase (AMP-forming)/AMP-acid ligase II